MMLAAALAAALLAPEPSPCPVTLPSGTAVRGGFAPSPKLPDFTIHNRETRHVLVKLEGTESGEGHVYFIGPDSEMTIRGVPLGGYLVSVAVAGRFGPDCRTLASAVSIYRFAEPFEFKQTVTENPDGSRDTQLEGHWIELGNDTLGDADAAVITLGVFND
jgi:hypothetical protein